MGSAFCSALFNYFLFSIIPSLRDISLMQALNHPPLTSLPSLQPNLALAIWRKKKNNIPHQSTVKEIGFFFFFYSSGFKVSQEHYQDQAGPSRAETFHNPNLPNDPSLAFNNCRHSLALLCDHAWMKSVKQLPELLGCLRLTFPQSKIYDLRAQICHGNGSNLPPWEKV